METSDDRLESGWEKGNRGEARAEYLLKGHNCWYARTSEIGERAALLHGPDGDKLILPDYLLLPDLKFLEVKNREYARPWKDKTGAVVDERLYIEKRKMKQYVTIARELVPVTIGIYTEASHRLFLADIETLEGKDCDDGEICGEPVYWYSIDDFRVGL